VKSGHDTFDHTADLGVRVWAPDRAQLVNEAVRAVYGVIGDIRTAGQARTVEWDLSADDPALLLRDLLAELLVIFERDQRIVTSVGVEEFSDARLKATGQAAPVDEKQSEFFREVKSITYHELSFEETSDGVEAVFIVDI